MLDMQEVRLAGSEACVAKGISFLTRICPGLLRGIETRLPVYRSGSVCVVDEHGFCEG